jgi:hypothetical protein
MVVQLLGGLCVKVPGLNLRLPPNNLVKVGLK